MGETWLISDTHFYHDKIITFTNNQTGERIRPEFTHIKDMNEAIIENWNAAVKPNDKVYHGGDFGCRTLEQFHEIASKLNGQKYLILGNHDNFDLPVYLKYFKKVLFWKKFSFPEIQFVFTHCPLLPMSFRYSDHENRFNIHGHIHEKIATPNEELYINVCVEHTKYRPINLEDLR